MARKSEKPGPAERAAGEPPPSFEAALAQLEEVVQQLEAGEQGLEESLKLYERGVSLLRACHEFLNQAEQRVRKLVTGPDGKPILEDLKLSPLHPEEQESAGGGEGEGSPAARQRRNSNVSRGEAEERPGGGGPAGDRKLFG